MEISYIISVLLKTNQLVPVSFFTEKFKITERSVRSDLKNVDDFLYRNGYPLLIRNRSGIALQLTVEERKSLYQLISEGDLPYIPMHQDRLRGIQLQLLFMNAPITIDDISESFKVSRSTIVSDINKLRKVSPGLGITSSKHGFFTQLEEWDNRIRITRLFSDIFPASEMLWNLEYEEKGDYPLMGLAQQSYFSIEQFKNAHRIAVTIESEVEEIWSDQWMNMVLFSILVCMLRRGYPIQPKMELRKTWAYSKIRRILPDMSKYLLDEADRDFITLIVLCSQTHNINYFKKENQMSVQVISRQIIQLMEQTMEYNFLDMDVLQEKLCENLSHAYYRIRYNISPSRRWLQGVDKFLNQYVKALESGVKILQEFVGTDIPNSEKQSIAALFYECYTLEEISITSQYHAVLVVDEDQEYGGMLKSWLTKAFPQIDIINVLPQHHLNLQHLDKRTDFVITTHHLFLKNTPEFLIKSLEDNNQFDCLREYMATNSPKQPNTGINSRHLLQKVLEVARTVCDRQTYLNFVNQLSTQVGSLDPLYYKGETQMLKDLLTVQTIRLAVPAENWIDAVRISGNLMVDSGHIRPQFVDAMVNFVVENGPYIVIAPGIALPHARPENGVERSCISLITLDSPVEFGNEDNDPVDLVIGLASVDNSSHLDALAELLELIGCQEKLALIRTAKTPEDVVALLK